MARNVQAQLAELLKDIGKNSKLKNAKQSAYTACEKGTFSNPESLRTLAQIYADMCDFQKAVHYQRLAVIYVDKRHGTAGTRRQAANLPGQH